jgi:methionyl-tRNA formyltransferase
MKISIICSDTEHPIYPCLQAWKSKHEGMHDIELVQRKVDLGGGDLLFLISCNEVLTTNDRSTYEVALVIHASDLPEGRGWSPHIWQILEGRNEFMVTLLEAEDQVDSGAIWTQRKIRLSGHELIDEINQYLFSIELELMDFAVMNFKTICPHQQDTRSATYYRQRRPDDSRLDPNKTIADQFDLLRVCDSNRYPAFFDYRGHRYRVILEKEKESENG